MTENTEDSEIRFNEFVADLTAGELYRGKKRIDVQTKPFKVLEVLLRAEGKFVSRSQLLELVWGGIYVGQRSLNTAVRKLRLALSDDAGLSPYIETLKGRGYRLTCDRKRNTQSATEALEVGRIRLTIKPFTGPLHSDDELFCQGLIDQVIALLGRMHGKLSIVVPMDRAYRGKDRRRASDGLSQSHCDFFLSGSVLRGGLEMRLVVRLTRSRDSVCVWSDSFLRERKGILTVQEALARQIVFAILRALPATPNSEAPLDSRSGLHEKYCKARYFAAKMSEDHFAKAAKLLNDILLQDPDYYPAYASLSLMLPSAALFGFLPPQQLFEELREVAAKAHQLMGGTAEPYIAIGMTNLLYEGDFQSAESALVQALAISPSLVHAHVARGVFMTAAGRFEDAFVSLHHALDQDPLSHTVHLALAHAYYLGGRYDAALKQLQQAHELDPYLPVGHALAGLIRAHLGDGSGAVECSRRAAALSPDSYFIKAHLAVTLAECNCKSEAKQLLQELLEVRRKSGWLSAYWIGLICAELGEREVTLDWLEVAFEEQDPWRVFSFVDSRLARVRDDARFHAMVRRGGIRMTPSCSYLPALSA